MNTSIRETWLDAQKRILEHLELEASEAKFDAQLLLQTALNVNKAWLLAHENDALPTNIHEPFKALLTRRLKGEPIAYILGQREFYGLNLIVTPDTLIPRPDTETLVEAALRKLSFDSRETILDLGTGTGAIALAIAKNRPQVNVTAIDASHAALAIAKKNATLLAITNVQFLQSDWFNGLANEKFNMIVSNPPYIEQNDVHLTEGDLRFEPITALASGADGLNDIRYILDNCLLHLNPQGYLILEHGYNQAEVVADLMTGTGLVNIQTIQDLGGNPRVTLGKNPLIVSTHWD